MKREKKRMVEAGAPGEPRRETNGQAGLVVIRETRQRKAEMLR